MLWYKSWLETRWRFLIGLALLLIVSVGTLFDYVATRQLMPLASGIEISGELGRRLREAIEVERDFRGFVWWQWFRQNLTQIGTLFAVLLGSGGLLSSTAEGTLFTLSLPASRSRLLGIRAATGLAEFLGLVLLPSLLISVLSPTIGQHYSIGDALVHSLCLFVAGAVFFSFAFFLSTVFSDLWRPLLIACLVAVVLAVSEQVVPALSRYGIFHVMSGEAYFRAGQFPWPGLLASMAVSLGTLYAATASIARRDF